MAVTILQYCNTARPQDCKTTRHPITSFSSYFSLPFSSVSFLLYLSNHSITVRSVPFRPLTLSLLFLLPFQKLLYPTNTFSSPPTVAVLRGDASVSGTVTFEQASESSPTTISYNITGNDPSAERGIHVHQFGDNTNGCTSAGPHCTFSQSPNSSLGRGTMGALRHHRRRNISNFHEDFSYRQLRCSWQPNVESIADSHHLSCSQPLLEDARCSNR